MVYRNYVIRTLSVIRSGRIMRDACSTHEREDKCIVSFGRNNGGKKTARRSSRRWKDNIKIFFNKIRLRNGGLNSYGLR